MDRPTPAAVIRRDDVAYILIALTLARPDLREAFALVAQAIGVSSPPAATITVELPRQASGVGK